MLSGKTLLHVFRRLGQPEPCLAANLARRTCGGRIRRSGTPVVIERWSGVNAESGACTPMTTAGGIINPGTAAWQVAQSAWTPDSVCTPSSAAASLAELTLVV